MVKQTDIAIVGGGIVGSVLALALSRQTSLNITLIDASPVSQEPADPGFDARVIALSRKTVDALNALGLNSEQVLAEPIKTIQVTDQGAAGSCHLHADDFRLDAFGQVVALSRLGTHVQQQLGTTDVTHLAPASVKQAVQHHEYVSLTLDNDEQCHAKLVVLADGGRSGLCESLNIARRSEAYEQTAIICNVTTSEPHRNWAYERFTPNGPLAFLPFNSDTSQASHSFSVVWTVTPDVAEALLHCDDAAFITRLQQAFGYRQGSITSVGTRHHYPLALEQAEQITAHRVAVTGNAAQTLHPIAGQGFNLGLRDVLGLVKAIGQADDAGAFACLREYKQLREADRKQTIWLTDTLVRTFSNWHRPLVAGRNLGLIALDNTPVLQQTFVNRTTGYGPATTGF
ncbi:2-octaprenyl-6-methoxyphenyl hydroxylase [Salinimonas lutimaris]|uniref:2-octaprenyl-6-methoxyphenyl hydroxylase n=1 Tax=Salinimonas lutimaris TaxID=914153 RepID=UPI0010C0B934|nr:2-octaprenyl-6-methoxyphenyl hydroxylase [Salinimonas lutimaris]